MKSVICLATDPVKQMMRQSSYKGAIAMVSGKTAREDDHLSQLEGDIAASSSVCNTMQSGSAIQKSKRRSYTFNESSGQMERVIRKRKRKTTN